MQGTRWWKRRGRGLLLAGGLALWSAGGVFAASASSNWPATIKGPRGFNNLGKAITNSPGFPKGGTDAQKARFVFNQLRQIAHKYGLRAGQGRISDNAAIGATRFGNDPENADSLKSRGVGNCGEWTYAFSEILDGAGVPSVVVFGDKSREAGTHSSAFTGTDTTVYVETRLNDGRTSRRVFDAFRAAYHPAQSGTSSLPTPQSIRKWSDLPLMETDKLARDQDSSWQKTVGKPYVKEAASQKVIPPKPRKAAPMPDLSGWWKARLANGNTFPVHITAVGEDGRYNGHMFYRGYRAGEQPGHFSGALRGLRQYWLDYTWSNAEPAGGDGKLTLDAGRNTLTGHWRDLRKNKGARGNWTLTRMSSPPKRQPAAGNRRAGSGSSTR